MTCIRLLLEVSIHCLCRTLTGFVSRESTRQCMFMTLRSLPIYTLSLLQLFSFSIIHSHTHPRTSTAVFAFQSFLHHTTSINTINIPFSTINMPRPSVSTNPTSRAMTRRGSVMVSEVSNQVSSLGPRSRGTNGCSYTVQSSTTTTVRDRLGSSTLHREDYSHYESGSSRDDHSHYPICPYCGDYAHYASGSSLGYGDHRATRALGYDSDSSDEGHVTEEVYVPLGRLTLGESTSSRTGGSHSSRHTSRPTESRSTARPTDSRHTSRPTESRSTARPTESRHASSRPSESRHTSSRPTESRHTSSRPTESRHTSSRPSESRHISSRPTESRHTSSRHPSSRQSTAPGTSGELTVYGERPSHAPSVSRHTSSRHPSSRQSTAPGTSGELTVYGERSSHAPSVSRHTSSRHPSSRQSTAPGTSGELTVYGERSHAPSASRYTNDDRETGSSRRNSGAHGGREVARRH